MSIVVTLGPATSSDESIVEVLQAGADAFRFPASKAPFDELEVRAREIGAVADELGLRPGLLVDLPGSKTRFTNDQELYVDKTSRLRIWFTPEPGCLGDSVPGVGISGADIAGLLSSGDLLLIGDGEVALRVEEVHPAHCVSVPLTAGVIGRRRGVAVPGKSAGGATLTESDRAALRKLAGTCFSAVILSFVESDATIRQARTIMGEMAGDRPLPAVIAKVETRAGVAAVRDIAECADAILLGRGDLLLEAGELAFHRLSENVIAVAAELRCPVIVGTELLNSCSAGWLANRSELAYASYLWAVGVNGMLLASETATSARPARAVRLLRDLRTRYATHALTPPMFSSRLS